jgi:hypothetical protein
MSQAPISFGTPPTESSTARTPLYNGGPVPGDHGDSRDFRTPGRPVVGSASSRPVVGQDSPGLSAGLLDAGPARPEREKAVNLTLSWRRRSPPGGRHEASGRRPGPCCGGGRGITGVPAARGINVSRPGTEKIGQLTDAGRLQVALQFAIRCGAGCGAGVAREAGPSGS